MRPTIGRIVHFVMPSGKHRPAIIVHVGDGYVNLTVFQDASDKGDARPVWHGSVIQDDAKDLNTWHWPEREDEEKPASQTVEAAPIESAETVNAV